MKVGEPKKFIIKGKRLDGRKVDELREIKIKAGVLERADGSAYVEWGENKAFAACYGPREVHPRHMERTDRAILRCRYNMAPFSVIDRKRPGPDRRSVEISKVTREALEPAVLLHLYPRTTIDVFIEILDANAGTRCTGITAASVALADAGIPMRDLVAACAAGKIGGKIVLDLFDVEDNYGEADLPIAMMPSKGKITLMQMDGNLSQKEFEEAFNLAKEGCEVIYQKQKEALKSRYEV
ncbi:MAG: exosome complex exonuclease Rrp41 [Candidatus Hydrothermarchaeales archaeon]